MRTRDGDERETNALYHNFTGHCSPVAQVGAGRRPLGVRPPVKRPEAFEKYKNRRAPRLPSRQRRLVEGARAGNC